ncbi:uncharacterized protein BDZ99DRAFT_464371 [Mytilinidion resinicola]|uniref:Uncharacterized protein n=1 Tax=Mytilinidion resinicola TaxID=574789 RepID=A0A6A6YI34_9PEZI|nr:uncharacterized protein BDZ99DRAFT_464371 [Mytilinidion resinicola]KAF2808502.1 hypothetical protein BDZ99DRAFT_464371 [Mytilinidion resinicola]
MGIASPTAANQESLLLSTTAFQMCLVVSIALPFHLHSSTQQTPISHLQNPA